MEEGGKEVTHRMPRSWSEEANEPVFPSLHFRLVMSRLFGAVLGRKEEIHQSAIRR